jgi:hypothetical protein
MTYEEQVERWRKAMRKSIKQIDAQKNGRVKFLIRVGILDKSGKRLAKPYR